MRPSLPPDSMSAVGPDCELCSLDTDVRWAAVPNCPMQRRWSENAELVSFRIGEHDPAHVELSHICPSRAEGEDALDLRLLVLRAEIEVEPILDDLAIWNLPEEDLRRDVDLAASLGRLDDVLLVALEGDAPSQSLRPEACETLAIGAVDNNGLNPDVHEPTIRGTPLVSNGRVRGSSPL